MARNYGDLKNAVDEITKNGNSYVLLFTPRDSLRLNHSLDFNEVGSATNAQKEALVVTSLKLVKKEMEKDDGQDGVKTFMDIFREIMKED